jgi:hypothetical protein
MVRVELERRRRQRILARGTEEVVVERSGSACGPKRGDQALVEAVRSTAVAGLAARDRGSDVRRRCE